MEQANTIPLGHLIQEEGTEIWSLDFHDWEGFTSSAVQLCHWNKEEVRISDDLLKDTQQSWLSDSCRFFTEWATLTLGGTEAMPRGSQMCQQNLIMSLVPPKILGEWLLTVTRSSLSQTPCRSGDHIWPIRNRGTFASPSLVKAEKHLMTR